MKTRIALLIVACGSFMFLTGCGEKVQVRTGFLSDYSKLEPTSKTQMQYINQAALANYNKFIISPVRVHLYADINITNEELAELKQYTYKVIYDAVETSHQVVGETGTGVARIRVAITNLRESNVTLNAIPHVKLTGIGLGAASMEAEIVDSVSGEQVIAVVQSQEGSRLSLDGYSRWGDAKSVIDEWAKELQERLLE